MKTITTLYRVFATAVIITASAAAVAAHAEDYDFKLHTYPNPFAPVIENANLFYVLPAGGVADVRVYDLQGRIVRDVATGLKRSPGVYEGEEAWDGRDDAGEIVLPGPYVIVLHVTIEGTQYRDTFVTVVKR